MYKKIKKNILRGFVIIFLVIKSLVLILLFMSNLIKLMNCSCISLLNTNYIYEIIFISDTRQLKNI